MPFPATIVANATTHATSTPTRQRHTGASCRGPVPCVELRGPHWVPPIGTFFCALRPMILGVASVATIVAVTVAAAAIGTTAATYAIGKATLTTTVTTAQSTSQWPARYASRFGSQL